MQVGDLVRYKKSCSSIGIVTSSENGYATVHWIGEDVWSWENNRDLREVINESR